MNTGKLDRKVVVEVSSSSKDQYGQDIHSWATHSTRWASFEARVSPSAAFGLPEVDEQSVMRSVAIFTFRGDALRSIGEFRLKLGDQLWRPTQIAENGTRGEWTVVLAEAFDHEDSNSTSGTVLETGKTLDELVEFFNEFGNSATPEIYYFSPPVVAMDPELFQSDYDAAGVPSLYSRILSGDYETKLPENIRHVARLDNDVPKNRLGQVLESENEFGNTWRFTFDDGTRFHPYMSVSKSKSDLDTRSAELGYTGSRNAYCIDHLTGLGVLYFTTRHSYHGTGNYTDAYDGFEFYDPLRWWQLEANQSLYTDANESDLGYLTYLDGRTVQGFSDWRLASTPEVDTLRSAAQYQYFSAGHRNLELLSELGLSSEYVSGAAGIEYWDRAEEGLNHAPWYAYRDANLSGITQGPVNFNAYNYDDEGNTSTYAGRRYYPTFNVTGPGTRAFGNFIGAYYYLPLLVRRHYGTSD